MDQLAFLHFKIPIFKIIRVLILLILELLVFHYPGTIKQKGAETSLSVTAPSCKLNLIGLNISQYCGSRLPATISKIKRSFSDKGLESMGFNNLPNEQNASLMAV